MSRILVVDDEPSISWGLSRLVRGMGHTVNPGERAGGAQGDANSIAVDAGGTAWGASDKRSPDGKAAVARLTATAARQ